MSVKIRYTDEPLGRLKIVRDFLPPPEGLVFRNEGVKVTIALSKRSVEFFKSEARRHNTQYQRMIRRLLDGYTEHRSRRFTAALNTDARRVGAPIGAGVMRQSSLISARRATRRERGEYEESEG